MLDYALASKLILPQVIYYASLEHIRGIKFTCREMEVIACLLNGRQEKTIASLLDIDDRAVGSHTHNIRRKLGCSSREGIINFIESSEQAALIKSAYYQSLKTRFVFEKNVQKILTRIISKVHPCIIIDWPNRENKLAQINMLKKHVREQLIKHLKLVGIKTTIIEKKNLKLNTYNDSVISIIDKEQLSHLLKEESSKFPKDNISSNITLIILDEKKPIETIQELNYVGLAEVYSISDYYHAFSSYIRKLYPEINLQELVNSSELTSYQNEIESQNSPSTDIPNNFLNTFQKITDGEGKSYISETPLSIRSDLIIPNESILLKRVNLINEISKRLNRNKDIKTVALVGVVGIGGAGKTTLARYYAQSQEATIIWEINAETRISIANSFKYLAYSLARTKEQKESLNFILKIQKVEERENQLLFFIKNILKQSSDWLLIYDNVDTFSDIKTYFPLDPHVWGKGKVIITTRDGNFKNTNNIISEDIIHIGELDEHEALTLFSKILFDREYKNLFPEEQEKALKFLKNIPSFPLDISIAAYYIKNSNITYEKYLDRIKKYSYDFDNAQKSLVKEISDYSKTRYGIITSSLERFANINPEFREILFFICLLDSQNIPINLLELYSNNVVVDNFMYNLRKNALLTSETSPSDTYEAPSFSLHRSTQAITFAFLSSILSTIEKEQIMKKALLAIKMYHNTYISKKCNIIIPFIPHLEALVKSLEELSLDKSIKKYFFKELFTLLGYQHYNCSRNLLIAKKYLCKVEKMRSETQLFSTKFFATLLKDLADICADLGEFDQALLYAQDSIEMCKNLKNTNILIAENLKTIGEAYSQQDSFEKSNNSFQSALKELNKNNSPLKKEIESEIYSRLSVLYSKTYLNKGKYFKAEEYAVKALEISNASKLFSGNQANYNQKIPCYIAKHKSRLGHVYNRSAKYDDAIIRGFQEAEYILKNSVHNCSYDLLLKGRIAEGLGEALLRQGHLEIAEDKLTEAIQIFDKLLSKSRSFMAKTFRAEARIRRGNLTSAYQDCIFVLKVKKIWKNNYVDLLYLLNHFHAAFIKHKQRDNSKSLEHLDNFFSEARLFCKNFLTKEEYNKLELKNVFAIKNEEVKHTKIIISKKFYDAFEIFKSIYGESHSFVSDYFPNNVLINR